MDNLDIEKINQGLKKLISLIGLENLKEVTCNDKQFKSYISDILPGFEHKKERNTLCSLNHDGIIFDLLQAKNTDEQVRVLHTLNTAFQRYGLKQNQIENLCSTLAEALGLNFNNLDAILFLDIYNYKKEQLLEIVSKVLDNTTYLNMKKETLFLRNVQKNMNDDVLDIVCIGSGSKYELQDAIVGQNILSLSVNSDHAMECMQMCVEMKYSKHVKAFVHFKENVSAEISFPIHDDIRSHISRSNGNNVIPPMEIPYEKLEEYLQSANSDEDNTKSHCFTRSALYSKLELRLPLDILRRGMRFFNFELDQIIFNNSKFISNYLSQADAILFVLNANKLCSSEEMDAIENRLSNCNAPILFVVNNFDLVKKQDDHDLITEYVNKTLSKFTSNPICLVSSKQAIEANQRHNSDLLEKSGIIKLKNELTVFLHKKRKNSIQSNEIEWIDTLKRLNHIIKDASICLADKMSALSKEIENRKNNIPKYKIVKLWNKIVGFMDSMVQSSYEHHEKELNELKAGVIDIEQMITNKRFN